MLLEQSCHLGGLLAFGKRVNAFPQSRLPNKSTGGFHSNSPGNVDPRGHVSYFDSLLLESSGHYLGAKPQCRVVDGSILLCNLTFSPGRTSV